MVGTSVAPTESREDRKAHWEMLHGQKVVCLAKRHQANKRTEIHEGELGSGYRRLPRFGFSGKGFSRGKE